MISSRTKTATTTFEKGYLLELAERSEKQKACIIIPVNYMIITDAGHDSLFHLASSFRLQFHLSLSREKMKTVLRNTNILITEALIYELIN